MTIELDQTQILFGKEIFHRIITTEQRVFSLRAISFSLAFRNDGQGAVKKEFLAFLNRSVIVDSVFLNESAMDALFQFLLNKVLFIFE